MDKVRQNHAEYRSCDMIEIEIAVIGVLRRDVEGRVSRESWRFQIRIWA